MDPLTAIGLTANILQFVEFVSKLISTGREIGESTHGATVENADLEAVSRSVVSLNNRVMESMPEPSQLHLESQALRDIRAVGLACNKVASELIATLETLKAGNRDGKWKGLVQAFRTLLTKGHIESLRARFDQYRGTMQTALIVSLR